MDILFAFFFFSLSETAEHLCFARSNAADARALPWIIGGSSLYLASLASWLWILAHLPLSIALPVSGLNYVTVAIASRVLLNERIDRRRALGIAVIVAGVIVIGLTGGGAYL